VSDGVMSRQGRVSLSDAAAFDGRPGSTGEARDFASAFLVRAQSEHAVPVTAKTADIVRLVVSELITNAAKYAPGPYLLELELTDDTAQVTVWDTEPVLPVPREPDPNRIGQHGLEIVLALCQRFDVERRAGGKRVSAHIATD